VNELERVEAQALRDAAVLGGGRAVTAGGAICLAHPRTPIGVINRAIPVGATVQVQAIAAWYGAHAHTVAASPGYLGLAQQLAATGYTPAGAVAKLQRGTGAPAAAATDLRIAETLDPRVFAHAAAAGYGMDVELWEELCSFVGAPGWRCFVALDGDDPVACGALYADGDHAWLGIAATRATHRGRGAQSALIAARLAAARAADAKRVAVETELEGPSRRNVERAGFALAYVREHWRSAT
jgi:GNAT superfamily N-acetyltransferase